MCNLLFYIVKSEELKNFIDWNNIRKILLVRRKTT